MNLTPYAAYVVEVDDETVGIVVRDEDASFRFYAAARTFDALEQRRFSSPRAAQRAAHALAHARRPARRAA